ncbi:Metal tolerance protein 9 [Cyphellophora attinorum]|uniref:Metal tolerance protein 9 n=1 Tax=Cyphellophora attinorum TaxID=1664694 RepID=A0A0N1HAX7_9EURO|nr:Metal tolerance protein 9 [Phialophora attinorum]KPI45413.1 Metal tolerance protein 9 [Phialophora attinorum]
MVGKRAFERPKTPREHIDEFSNKGDVESGPRTTGKRRFPKFKDAVDFAMAERTQGVLKKQLVAGIDRECFEEYRMSDEKLKEIKDKKVRAFYEEQNARLDDWLEVDTVVKAMAGEVMDSMNPDADHDGVRERGGGLQNVEERIDELLPDRVQEDRRKAAKMARWAININVIANIILLAAKGAAALKSTSLSLIASLLDSALDLLCTVIVWTTNRLVSWRLDSLARRFPVGRQRLEPLGILVFSIIMVISFLQILQESVTKLLPSGDHSSATLPAVAIGAMAGTVVVKGIIGIGCYRIKTTQVQALFQDCKTDVYFNTLSLLFPLIGKQAGVWWLDPLGAALLSLYIIYDWADTCLENVTRLCGSAAEKELDKKLTYLLSICADGVWVEYDVLLDEKSPLRRTHDISETLQYCAEALEEVDRCFVSMDYSAENPVGHSAGA